jgi:hypothetical protein
VHRTNQAIRGFRKVMRMTPEEIEVITQKYKK